MSPLRPASGARRVLLERADELALLAQAVREVADGGSATVVVHGRPGTGRSTLLAETAVLARRAGLHVVTAPTAPYPGPEPTGAARSRAGAQEPPAAPVAFLRDEARQPGAGPVESAQSLVRRSGGRPLLYVVACADPSVLAEVGPPHHEILLRPLSARAVRALLVEAYGEEAAGPLVPAALAATGGNPAVLCGTLHRRPAPAPGPEEFVALADQVGRHQLRSTLARAPRQAVALLRAAAAADGDFSFHQVCELADIHLPARERARADAARTGLLGPVTDPRLYDALVTDRLLGLMDDRDRDGLHESAVRLERRYQGRQSVLGRLVARTGLTDSWVPEALYAAGVEARRSGDDAGAATLLASAEDRGAQGGLRTEVLLELARAQLSLHPDAADRGFLRVLAEPALRDGSTARLFAADVLALRGGSEAASAIAAAAALRTTPAPQQRALHGLRELTLTDTGAPDHPGPAPAPEAGPDAGAWAAPFPLPAADGAGGGAADAARAAAVAWRLCSAGREIGRARRLAAGALARAGAGQFAPALVAARVLVIADGVELARHGLERIEAEARRQGVRPAVGLALLNWAELALRTGDVSEACSRLDEAIAEVPRRHWHPRRLPRLTALEALIALESGRPDLAESAVSGAVPDRHEYGVDQAFLLFARGLTELRTGRTAAAAHLRECGRMLLALGCTNPGVVPWRSQLALALAGAEASAAPDAISPLLAEELAAAGAWGAASTVGSVHLRTGLALPGPKALVHLCTAVRILTDSVARGRRVQALAELADALFDDGRPGEGRRALDQAVSATRARPGLPAGRVAEVAARYEELPRTNRARLSPAQLRVALLAAEGWSNRAIALELSVSLRTVELHLTHSYRALGITDRSGLPTALGHDAGTG
ncbi:LuxR C-terminal-related transcriptional regulator [Streptomyces sp. NPDC059063]|uniref:helix-turn-helix transcriptional regulator n=1 Tax=Streptomyces sp. NPDC059063 TaxID=3346712 RepID=UPI0036D06CF4